MSKPSSNEKRPIGIPEEATDEPRTLSPEEDAELSELAWTRCRKRH